MLYSFDTSTETLAPAVLSFFVVLLAMHALECVHKTYLQYMHIHASTLYFVENFHWQHFS